MGGLPPEEAHMALVQYWRAKSLQLVTLARMSPAYSKVAWESTVSLAELLLTTPTPGFRESYVKMRASSKTSGIMPLRTLWRLCNQEMVAQGYMGVEETPLSRERLGVLDLD